jgi:hypothetical protein
MPMRVISRSAFTGDHVIVLLQLHAVVVHSRAGSLSSSTVASSEVSLSLRSQSIYDSLFARADGLAP